MVNTYYDHDINDKVSVYGGLGLGFSVAEATFLQRKTTFRGVHM